MSNILKTMKFLSFPIGLAIAAYVLLIYISNLSMSSNLAWQYAPYVFLLIGMMLGLRFNKSKIFFLCLVLGLGKFTMSIDLYTFNILSVLIPINIFAFSLFKERGIFTAWGKFKFGFLLAQSIFVWWLHVSQNTDIKALIHYSFIHYDFIERIPMPQLSILIFLLVFLALNIKLYLNPTLMDSSLIGTVIMTFIGLLMKDNFIALNLFQAMNGLILIIGVVETSYFMAYRDELTKIPARRALKEAMMKLSGKYTIAMIDIDFFKKFNDTYGHDAGDEVLKIVASNLADVGGGGKAFRFGGEEFTILFPNKTKAEVIPQLEDLRKIIAKQRYTYKKKRKVNGKDKVISRQLGVTISIGVAEKSEHYKTSEDVLQSADKALYRAKKNGRNCISK